MDLWKCRAQIHQRSIKRRFLKSVWLHSIIFPQQQIRWIWDYLHCDNSLHNVANPSIILFPTSDKIEHHAWDNEVWHHCEMSIKHTHRWVDDGVVRLVTDGRQSARICVVHMNKVSRSPGDMTCKQHVCTECFWLPIVFTFSSCALILWSWLSPKCIWLIIFHRVFTSHNAATHYERSLQKSRSNRQTFYSCSVTIILHVGANSGEGRAPTCANRAYRLIDPQRARAWQSDLR